MPDDDPGGDARPAEGPVVKGADRAPGGKAKADAPEAASSLGSGESVTEEEALRVLSSTSSTIRDEHARAAGIIDDIVERLGGELGLRAGSIGSINVLEKVDIASGGFTIGAGGSRESAHRRPLEAVALLDVALVERRARSYVRPSGFDRALEILSRRRLLILCGPQGSGREAAALALLTEKANRDRLYLVSGDALLGEHGWSCGPAGTGFAVSPLQPPDAGKLDDVWLEQTAKRLSDTDNYMVVVTGPPSGAFSVADGRTEFAFEELGAPDAMAVLRKRARIAIDPAKMPDLLSLLSRAEIREIIATDGSPSFVARVAKSIAEALNENKDVEQTLNALRDPASQVQAWFNRYDRDNETDYRQLVLPIAVSVLEDSSYLSVSDAAVALYRQLFAEEETPPPLRFRRALQEQQQWIQLISSDDVSAPHVEQLRFRSPLLRPAVLQYTWSWLDGIRPALSVWLDGLAVHSDVDVRARTAASAGLLATLDFSYVLNHFLYRWAVNRSAAARDCAALALTIPGRSPRHKQRVWALLRQWAGDRPEQSGARLAGTAALAAGSALGCHRPHDALGVLHEVLKRDEWDSLTVLVLAVMSLAENGCVAEVLSALLDWSGPDDGSAPVIKALAAFALIARTPTVTDTVPPPAPAPDRAPRSSTSPGSSRLTGTALSAHRTPPGRPADLTSRPGGTGSKPAARGSAPDDRAWPVFLKEASRNMDAIRDLWGRALNAKPVRPLALDALHYWLEVAGEDTSAFTVVSRAIHSIARLGGKHPDRLDYYLDLWAHDPKRPLRAAQWLIS